MTTTFPLPHITDEKDGYRLDRMEKYVKGNYAIKSRRESQHLLLSYEGIRLVAGPLYLVDANNNRILFQRVAAKGTPLQNVENQLAQALEVSSLPKVLKVYLMDMYLKTTDLRVKTF